MAKSGDKSLISLKMHSLSYYDCLCFIYSDICLLDSNKKLYKLINSVVYFYYENIASIKQKMNIITLRVSMH
jgi:hypothetical protein